MSKSLEQELCMGKRTICSEEDDSVLNDWQNSRETSLSFLKRFRERLVEELERSIDCIVEHALQKQLISKDDYEDVVYERGPRKQVRKLLDIIDCLGEESASGFCSLFIQIKNTKSKNHAAKENVNEYLKLIEKHKNVLLRRNDCLKYYNCRHGEKFYFSDHFVNLLLVNGHYSLEIKKNELLTFGQQRIHLQNKKGEKFDINIKQLFQKLSDRRVPKKILVSGVAGIGKTVFVQKILYDFAKTKAFDNFEFAINFTFRDLNLISKRTTLREIILKKNGHLSQRLDDIFQNSEKLLLILDGFDEFKFYNQIDLDDYVFEPDEEAELCQIVGSLIKGELLPEATILVTSRPTVINHIPVDCIERFVVITGFSVTEIEDYFQKFYGKITTGSETFRFVKENHFLFTLCYIPAFCWIVCSVLKENSTYHIGQPKTMTDIYCHYLVVLLKYHTHQAVSIDNDSEDSSTLKAIIGLGQLAYQSLLQHETLFYEHDLEMYHKLPSNIINSFLDKMCVQELEYTEHILSFTHFTIQEFFAAFYYAHEANLVDDIMDLEVQRRLDIGSGYLDLFQRFLSGLLSARNQNILLKHLKLSESQKTESYISWLIKSIINHCENGSYILNLLHCFFEQQRDCLANGIIPSVLRLNLSDNIFSPIDCDVLIYFLSLVHLEIDELDLTATHVNAEYLKQLEPYILHCRRLWLGENNLDIEAIRIISNLLSTPDTKIEQLGLGWAEIEDEGFLELYKSLKINQSLKGLWLEGNNISYEAVEQFSDITEFNSTLQYAVLLGNNLQEDAFQLLRKKRMRNIIVVHIDDDYGQEFWQGWWDWIFQRCQLCGDEKIVSFLTKVCIGLGLCQGRNADWMASWYIEVDNLLQERIKQCLVVNVKKRLEALRQMFCEQSVHKGGANV
ncbi:NACHT, LRR and PYD domains-containing protein 3 [Bombina bombina]|uniref:NACHT, LRR and PYD domains-containing protein 3 n=1 Tax=Bombina bombina TaxID=8345 RepID=UPI00235A52DD|nr:NACHT, LRR and PYD domains-containing protein 3 [Bombina bombina]